MGQAHATTDPPSPRPTGPGRSAAMIRLIADIIARRAAGEPLTDSQVIADHPELMPDLLDELEGLRVLQRAWVAGQKAGPLTSPIAPVPLEQIDAPILPADAPEQEIESKRLCISGYQIYREISSGGQATVYQALQESTGKTVAIKVLPGGALAGSHDRTRFDREAEILAKLDHPNIVGIVDRGRTADGSFFFVMQYIDGKPLDDFAAACRAQGAAGMRRLISVFLKLARAVGEAHARAIVHRDLKPSNILVDARDEPHLLDFGLARPLAHDDPSLRVRTITLAGQVVGSLPWASPEQVCGAAAHADPRSDVYALGVCLHQCLTGVHPYCLEGSIAEIVNRIRYVIPPPVSGLPGMPAEATAIVDRMLSKAPQDRYPDAAALAIDLEALALGKPIQRPPWEKRRTSFKRANAIALVAILFTLCLAAGIWSVWPKSSRTRLPVTDFGLPRMTNSLGMTLVKIPAGSFGMGTPASAQIRGDDERSHAVRISAPFWIATREVTRGQFFEVMKRPATPAVDDQLPMTGVSWLEATEFCRRLGEREECQYRLPLESEWEYACRAGTNTAWSGSGDSDDMAWTAQNSGGRLHRPGEKQYNHWGLHDMHGNAAEWCWDWYNPIYPATEVDPVYRDATARRVVRGGAYDRPAPSSRSAARGSERPDSTHADIGFRVVREDPDAPHITPPAANPQIPAHNL